MTCAEIREELTAWLDRELSPADARRVERHVEGCAACRREADALARTYELLGRLPVPSVPAGFVQRFWKKARGKSVRRLLPWAIPLAVAAAAAIVAVVVFVSAPPGSSEPIASPDSPAVQQHAELSPEERQIVEDLDVLGSEEFEAATHLDVLDRMDAAEELDEEAIDILGSGGR